MMTKCRRFSRIASHIRHGQQGGRQEAPLPPLTFYSMPRKKRLFSRFLLNIGVTADTVATANSFYFDQFSERTFFLNLLGSPKDEGEVRASLTSDPPLAVSSAARSFLSTTYMRLKKKAFAMELFSGQILWPPPSKVATIQVRNNSPPISTFKCFSVF